LPVQTVPAGGLLVIDAAALGFVPASGSKLFLVSAGGAEIRDAREVSNRLQGALPDGRWGFPTSETPGGANVVTVTDAIVINEIFYHAPGTSQEQWVELYNKGSAAVDVSLWRFSDGIDYQFPAATPPIPAGGFAVVAWLCGRRPMESMGRRRRVEPGIA
jgi:hypothetical protein